MKSKRVLELALAERECCKRNIEGKCDRNCGKCDLVQDDKELMDFWDTLVGHYKKKLEKKGYLVLENKRTGFIYYQKPNWD